jgi:hypothetical protein
MTGTSGLGNPFDGRAVKRVVAMCLVAGTTLFGGTGYGQETNLPPVAPADLQLAARVALAQGVNWLKQEGTDDPDGWIVGPFQQRKVIAWTNIVTRYSVHKKTYTSEHPVYEYSNVVVFIPGSVGEAPRKVVQKRPVKQIGTRKVEYERTVRVSDPNGTVVGGHRLPVAYDPNGTVTWHARNLGDAALTAYALRQAGVDDTDPVLQRMLENLRGHVETYGLPDQTWNLAWLWGPICVHHGLLAALLRDYLAVVADVQKKDLKLKEKHSKAAEAARDAALRELEDQKTLVESICQRGLRFGNVEYSWSLDPNTDPQVFLDGADHCLYNQAVADMESTWVALTALSIAGEHDRLLTETLRPKASHRAGGSLTPIPPAERTEAVMARAANGLVAQQAEDGRWSECNLHQPVTRFAAFSATLPVPPDPKGFPPLPSPVTPASAAQGIAALNGIAKVVGMDRLMKGFSEPYARGIDGRQKALEAMLAAAAPKPGARPALKMADYDLLLALPPPPAEEAAGVAVTRANEMLLRTLILAGATNGSWGRGLAAACSSTSTRARYEALKTVKGRVWNHPRDPVEMNKAHLWLENLSTARHAEGYATAVAVIYLAGLVEKPETAADDLAANPSLADLRAEVERQLIGKPAPKTKAKPKRGAAPPAATPAATNAAPNVERVPVAPAEKDVPDAQAFAAPPASAPKTDEGF